LATAGTIAAWTSATSGSIGCGPIAPSERVKILGIEKRKQATRVDIEFLDGDKAPCTTTFPLLVCVGRGARSPSTTS
jgi:hypothetical protein